MLKFFSGIFKSFSFSALFNILSISLITSMYIKLQSVQKNLTETKIRLNNQQIYSKKVEQIEKEFKDIENSYHFMIFEINRLNSLKQNLDSNSSTFEQTFQKLRDYEHKNFFQSYNIQKETTK